MVVSNVDEQNDGEETPSLFAKGDTPDFQWYIVRTLSGHENKVAKALKERILDYKLQEHFSEVHIPEETVVTNVGGKKRSIKKKFFPGYILIKMIMSDKTWHLVKSTDKISGFVGGTKEKPLPISAEEAAYMTNQSGEGFAKKSKSKASFSEGDSVKVTEGPFTSFVGTIEAVGDKGKVRVQVSIFGRPTPVELDASQIEKV